MFAPDPAAAAREIARVLRPGGRVALAVWGPRARNPWLGLVFDAVAAQLGEPVPPPGIPGPFALADATGCRACSGAGLTTSRSPELPVPLRAGFDEWWRGRRARRAARRRLAELPEPAATALLLPRPGGDQRVRDAHRPRDPRPLPDRLGHARLASNDMSLGSLLPLSRRAQLPLHVVEPLALELDEPVAELMDEDEVGSPVG